MDDLLSLSGETRVIPIIGDHELHDPGEHAAAECIDFLLLRDEDLARR